MGLALLLAVYQQTVGDAASEVWALIAGVPTSLGALAMGMLAQRASSVGGQGRILSAGVALIVLGLGAGGLFTLGLPFFAIGVALLITALLLRVSTRALMWLLSVILLGWMISGVLHWNLLSSFNNLFALDSVNEYYGHTTWVLLSIVGLLLARNKGFAVPARDRFAVVSIILGLLALIIKGLLLLTNLGAQLAQNRIFQTLTESLGSGERGYLRGLLAYFPLSGGLPDLLLNGLIATALLGVGVVILGATQRSILVSMGSMVVSLFFVHAVVLQAGYYFAPSANENAEQESGTLSQAWWYTNDPLTIAQDQEILDLMRTRLNALDSSDLSNEDVAVLLNLPRRTVNTANTWMDSIEMPIPEDLSAVPGISGLVADTIAELDRAKNLSQVDALADNTEAELSSLIAGYWRAQGRDDIADGFVAHDSKDEYRAANYPAAWPSGPGVAPWWFLVDLAILFGAMVLQNRVLGTGVLEAVFVRLMPQDEGSPSHNELSER